MRYALTVCLLIWVSAYQTDLVTSVTGALDQTRSIMT